LSKNFFQIFQVVRGSRKIANPNSGFQKQLAEFESSGAVERVRKN
jgi:hypothetical protein